MSCGSAILSVFSSAMAGSGLRPIVSGRVFNRPGKHAMGPFNLDIVGRLLLFLLLLLPLDGEHPALQGDVDIRRLTTGYLRF
jgi:hypothetical protein